MTDYATTQRIRRIKRRELSNEISETFTPMLAKFALIAWVALICLMVVRGCTDARACEVITEAKMCTVTDQARLDLESLLVDREALLPVARKAVERQEEEMLELFKFEDMEAEARGEK